jgi:hypothetical protein
MGTSMPLIAGRYLADGSVDKIFLEDHALSGVSHLALIALCEAGV